MTGPVIDADPVHLRHELQTALMGLVAAGRRPPCSPSTGGGDLWFSDAPADQAAARGYCQRCALLVPCGAVGAFEPAGTWGGVTRLGKASKRWTEADDHHAAAS